MIFILPTEYDKRFGIKKSAPSSGTVDILDFETDDEDSSYLSYECRCQGVFSIDRNNLEFPVDVPCSNCSLYITVDRLD